MQFTKEQLITHITRHSDEISRLIKQQSHHDNEYRKKLLAVNEIAMAVLTAPDFIPPHVEDAMGDMCDGGFNAQGIWDLCRESIMPPSPCPRCGTVSDRPDGVHYCHVGNKNDK